MGLKDKLRDWIVRRFGNVNKAAEAMDEYPRTIHNYIIEDGNLPGAPFLIKCWKFGCDLNWLLGDSDELPQEKLIKEIERLIKENDELRREIKKKEKSMIEAIKKSLKNF